MSIESTGCIEYKPYWISCFDCNQVQVLRVILLQVREVHSGTNMEVENGALKDKFPLQPGFVPFHVIPGTVALPVPWSFLGFSVCRLSLPLRISQGWELHLLETEQGEETRRRKQRVSRM